MTPALLAAALAVGAWAQEPSPPTASAPIGVSSAAAVPAAAQPAAAQPAAAQPAAAQGSAALPGMPDSAVQPVTPAAAPKFSLPAPPAAPAPPAPSTATVAAPPAAASPPPAAPTASPHPLDPLSASELAEAAALLKDDAHFPENGRFHSIVLEEPAKRELERYDVDRSTPARRAAAIVLESARSRTYEATVNLTKHKVEKFLPKAGIQAGLLFGEFSEATDIARADAGWREALRRRGLADGAPVHLDAWAPSTTGVTPASGPRLIRVIAYYRGKSSNSYARPVEGLVALVDMSQRKVVRIEDSGEIPLSQEDGAIDDSAADRSLAPKALELKQPEGPSFEQRGWEVRWFGWSFRFALHPREGPVLYDVAYADAGRRRGVLRRGSVSEALETYGDGSPAWAWRSAFQAGEYGLGRLASPLEAGADVPAYAQLLDADFIDDWGKIATIPRALALYERDAGPLWRHYRRNREAVQSRRGRELVLASITTLNNDDYALEWIFGQDGSITFNVRLTGVLAAKGVPEEGEDLYSHRLSTRIAAPAQQHFFSLRLDFDVDGHDNFLYELATVAVPYGKDNPEGNAFTTELRPLKSEAKARRELDLGEGRRWLVAGQESLRNGRPAGYLLSPGMSALPYARPGSAIRNRATFLEHAVWATRYKPDELYAAGLYPNQAPAGEGLSRFAEDDESLDGKDLVLWHTLGVTRTPRAEDWPAVETQEASARLVPWDFFRKNPAVSVPRK